MPILCPAPLSLLAEAAVVPTTDTFRQLGSGLWEAMKQSHFLPLVWVVLSQVLVVAACWLASKPLTEWRATRGQAVKVYFLYLLQGLLFGAVMLVSAIMIPMAFASLRVSHTAGPAITFVGFSVLAVVALLLTMVFSVVIPMRVYRIGMLLGLMFLLLAGLLSLGGLKVLSFALRHPMGPGKEIVAQWVAVNLGGDPPPTVIEAAEPTGEESDYVSTERRAADRSKSLSERHAAVKELYDRLENSRKALVAGDAKALSVYERRKARYEQLLNDLKAEVIANHGSAI